MHANLKHANFRSASLGRANFERADLTEATLVNANLSASSLHRTMLSKSDISGADFFEVNLTGATMRLVKGAHYAHNLLTTHISGEVSYFPTVIRNWRERWVDWERIRIAGRLPLFGLSYTGLIIIPIYIYLLGIYNDKIEAVRTWITDSAGTSNSLPESTAQALLKYLNREPVPESFFLLLVSTVLLAIAATIYTLACPSRIKTFSRDQWCDELGHSLVHYWPQAWKWRELRLTCAIFYILGFLGAAYVLLSKLAYVAIVLYRAQASH